MERRHTNSNETDRGKPLKIAHFDIEASNLSANLGYCISAAIKWSDDKTPQVFRVDNYKTFKKDPTNDRLLIKDLAEAMNGADLWTGWYSSRFDVPFVNTRLLQYGFAPLAPVPHVDLWRTARFGLKLHSNRLAVVGDFLGIEDKTPIKWECWRRAPSGHKQSIDEIVKHNVGDVIALEKAYEQLKPFIKQHPNVSIMASGETDGCPICGSERLQARGWIVARTRRRKRYNCQTCGAWSSGKSEPVDGRGIRGPRQLRSLTPAKRLMDFPSGRSSICSPRTLGFTKSSVRSWITL